MVIGSFVLGSVFRVLRRLRTRNTGDAGDTAAVVAG
jgi:hypothetical protein